MNIFEKTTLKAVEILNNNSSLVPSEAWLLAISSFTSSSSMIKKSCPKNTFIDLCNSGLIRGIKEKDTFNISENGRMILKVYDLLNKNNWQIQNKKLFWYQAFNKEYENQLDILLILKENNLLKID